jgi:O-acetyl-ADP-ribose deacetylase (regulator of RNase III)
MKIIKGDLLNLALEGKFDVIVHGCNCFHNFGAGIALQILKRFPIVFEQDKKTVYGDRNKLGSISFCTVPLGRGFVAVNAYTQYACGVGKRQVDYIALRNCFKCIKKEFTGYRIGYPLIGAGLAGGDWDIISEIINNELGNEDHTLVEYSNKETK